MRRMTWVVLLVALWGLVGCGEDDAGGSSVSNGGTSNGTNSTSNGTADGEQCDPALDPYCACTFVTSGQACTEPSSQADCDGSVAGICCCESPGSATLVVAHANSTQGEVSFVVGDTTLTTVDAGEVSAKLAIPASALVLMAQAPGASVSLVEQPFTPEKGSFYLVGLLGSPTEAASLRFYDITPPSRPPFHVVSVANLRTDDLAFTVAVGDQVVVNNPAPLVASEWFPVATGATSLTLSGADLAVDVDVPILADAGAATMVVVGGEGATDVTVKAFSVP